MTVRVVVVASLLAIACGKSENESPKFDEKTRAAAATLVADTTALTDEVCGACQTCTGQPCRDCLDNHAAGTLEAMKAAAATLSGKKALHEIRSHKDLVLPDEEQKVFLAAIKRGNLCVQKINDRAPWGLGSADAGASKAGSDGGAATATAADAGTKP